MKQHRQQRDEAAHQFAMAEAIIILEETFNRGGLPQSERPKAIERIYRYLYSQKAKYGKKFSIGKELVRALAREQVVLFTADPYVYTKADKASTPTSSPDDTSKTGNLYQA